MWPNLRDLPKWLAFLGIGLLMGGCDPRPAPPAPSPVASTPEREQTRVAGQGYRFVFPPDARPRVWALTADFQGEAQSGTVRLTKVTGTLYKKNAPVLEVTAGAGTAVIDGKTSARLALTDHVHARASARGYTLDAAVFRWSTRDGLIHAERVVWRGEGLTHRADTGTFATDLSQATFAGHVTTVTDGYPGKR